MSNHIRARSRTFLLLSLLLLLAAGLYYRVAHPSLRYHLEHGPSVASPSAADPAHDHPPLSPEENAELARLMGVLRQSPSDVNSLLAIADLFSRNKDWRNALAFFDRAAQAAPSDMRPWYFRGVALAGIQDYAGAAAAFEHALERVLGNDSIRYNLAVLYRYHLNRPSEAASLFGAIVASPAAPESLKARAREEVQGK